jgi:hypothetical protein
MRKFGKTIITFAAAMFAAFSLTACQGGSSKTSIDVSSLADDLNAKTIKSDTLTETSSDMLSTIYFFENGQVSESKAFMSSGATADEICVVKCVDENAAKAVTELFQTRVNNQSKLYESYNADEVGKLDDAIIKSSGSYAVLVVCDDYDEAGDVLKEAGF